MYICTVILPTVSKAKIKFTPDYRNVLYVHMSYPFFNTNAQLGIQSAGLEMEDDENKTTKKMTKHGDCEMYNLTQPVEFF